MAPSSTKYGIAISAVALVGAYVLGTPGTGGAATDAAAQGSDQQFEDLGVFTPEPRVDDGLNRLVIELPVELANSSGPPSTAESTTDGLELARLIEEEGTALLLPDSDGNIWAHYPDGRKVLVSGHAPAPVTRDQLIASLSGDREITDVRSVDADTLAVVTTYTEAELLAAPALEELDLEVLADEPIEAFEDQHFGSQWGLENTGQGSGYLPDADIDVLDAWTGSSGGAGVIVAVLDTGVDYGHADLATSRWVNAAENCANGTDDDGNGYVDDCYGWDFVGYDNSPWDGNNHFHGTHVAGIIGARRDTVGIAGVAPDVTIMDLRVLDTRGSGYTSGFAQAIRYAVDNGAHIINMSLGSQPGTSRSGFGSVEQAVQYAQSRGVLIVAAAGNSNVDIDTATVWPASYAPLYDNVMTVASTDYADQRSSFSNYGVASVTIGAPGSQILSTVPGGGWSNASGTSMAAPMAAGAAALLLGELPGTAPDETIARLVTVADPLQSLSGKLVNPARINVGSLYEALGSPVRVQASGLSGLYEADGIQALLHMRVNDLAMFAGRDFTWQARLLAAYEGVAYGVVDHQVFVNGSPGATDTEAVVALSGAQSIVSQPSLGTTGFTVGLATALPAGTYALVVEAESTDGTSGLVAPPQALFFTVAEGSAPTTTTTTPTTPDGGGPVTTAPTTSLPGPTWPSTTVPGGTWPTTTAPAYWPSPSPYPSPSTTYLPGETWPTTTWAAPTYPEDPYSGPTYPEDPYAAPTTTWAWSPTTLPPTTLPPNTLPPNTLPPPSTTAAPGTQPAPDSSSPTTTAAPGTQPAPGSPAPAPGWSIAAVSPSAAEVRSNDLVTLYGTFPLQPHVWFGDSKAIIVSGSASKLIVELPTVKRPAVVDITLRIDQDVVFAAPWAFTFYQPGEPWPTIPVATTVPSPSSPTTAPATTTAPGSWPTTTAAPGGWPTTTVAPGGWPTTTAAPGGWPTTTAAPGSWPTTTTAATIPPTTIPVDQSKWYTPGSDVSYGPAVTLPNGLRAAPVTYSGPVGQLPVEGWSDQACSTSSCVATSL